MKRKLHNSIDPKSNPWASLSFPSFFFFITISFLCSGPTNFLFSPSLLSVSKQIKQRQREAENLCTNTSNFPPYFPFSSHTLIFPFTLFPSTYRFLSSISPHNKIPPPPLVAPQNFQFFAFPKRSIRLNSYLCRDPLHNLDQLLLIFPVCLDSRWFGASGSVRGSRVIMPPAVMDPPLPESSSVLSFSSDIVFQGTEPDNRGFGNLRGLQWRINLGVLPYSSIDDLRRATANSRRRYASLRGRLLIDPHVVKDESSVPNLVMDNPLSQNPDSTWSRFFRNAEIERMIDQDLSRLYPEHGSYFQTPGCQGILRRILLLWCHRHPECGYRQGMHELLAPVLYVLQYDVECLLEVRKLYEDHFTDRFDDLLCQENDLSYNFDFRKSSDSKEDGIDSNGNAMKIKSLDELDPKIQNIVLLSDAYGAEGELGIVLSEKFIEHDAYCMFDALMSGARGSISMIDFFSYSPLPGSHTGLPPVIEASAALYHLLSHVDSSLHAHLVDLGVEPQYFALRWLRVLFGREFSLSNLLIIWDEIFLSDNSKVEKHVVDNADSGFRIFNSSRGAFISAMAVAMMLHLRSSLLAAENPTTCLQRLLNFPENTDIEKLIEKAKSLQALALSTEISSSMPSFVEYHNHAKPVIARSNTLSSESISPKTPVNLVPESYWEKKWRVIHKAEELKQDGVEKQVPSRKKGWTEKVKFSLRRTESDPSSPRSRSGKKESKSPVRRNLLEDLSKELGFEEDTEKLNSHDNLPATVEEEQREESSACSNCCSPADRCLSQNTSSVENSPAMSCSASPPDEANDLKNDCEKSSVGSNLSLDGISEASLSSPFDSPLAISDRPQNVSNTTGKNNNISAGNSTTHSKERKLNKFQWLWKLGRNNGEFTEKGSDASEAVKPANSCDDQNNTVPSSTANTHCSPLGYKGESTEQNMTDTMRNIGQSMLEHIQVIEKAFQQWGEGASLDNMSENVVLGEERLTPMSALKELRKISNILSEI